MSLKDVYQRFLADPRSASLASDASLIYIPTTTKLEGAEAVISHINKQQKDLKTKGQDVLGVIESADAVCLDIETTLEFVNSGGVYLPSLDDNFLTDRVAAFPTVHIVRFNANKQIQNIRIYWEQASLLRQVEIIGSRGRSWPIRDSRDQIRLIKSAIAAQPSDSGSALPPSNTEESEKSEQSARSGTPGKRRIRDPYAAESLTELLSPGNDERTEHVRAPRAAASAKPPPRDYEDLFVGDGGDEPDASPSKPRSSIAPKAGAGRNFERNRLFDDDEQVAAEQKGTPVAYRPHPNRFSHFDIGGDNGDREIQEKPAPGRAKSRHTAQWGFDDFVTPEKPRRQLRPQEVNHFPWSDDGDGPTPAPKRYVTRPRRDAETHFDMGDDDKPRMVSSFQNKGMSLYRDPLFDEAEEEPASTNENKRPQSLSSNNNRHRNYGNHWEMPDEPVVAQENKRPLSLAHNSAHRKNFESHWDLPEEPVVEQENKRPHSLAHNNTHRKNFESHWDMVDESPVDDENKKPLAGGARKRVPNRNMESSWELYDDSPRRPSVAPPRSGVRNAYQRSWDLGDE